MRAAKTYFEQIPVETVTKIAEPLPHISADEVKECTGPMENWEEITRQIEREEDPQKLAGLASDLVRAFEEKERRKNPLMGAIVCAVCHKAVDLKISKTDDRGRAVHEECYVQVVTRSASRGECRWD